LKMAGHGLWPLLAYATELLALSIRGDILRTIAPIRLPSGISPLPLRRHPPLVVGAKRTDLRAGRELR